MADGQAQGAEHGAAAALEDDGFTPEERAQFQQMAQETPAPAAEPPPQLPLGQEPAPAGDEDDDDGDEASGAQSQQPQQPGQKPPPRRVNYGKFQRMEERASKAEREAQQLRENFARADERLRLLNEALAPKPDQRNGEEDDPEPDPETDIFAHNRWLGRQLAKINGAVQTQQQTTQASAEEQQLADLYVSDARSYAQKEPAFAQAYQWLMANRTLELAEYFFGKDLTEQGVELTPQEVRQIQQAVSAEERDLVAAAFKKKESPSARIMRLAKARGFRPQAPQAGAGGAPQGGGQPQGGQAPQGGQQPRQGGQLPNVAEEISRIQRGTQHRSLSQAGGAPANAMTAERLAAMPQDEFEAFVEGLSQSQLRAIMGN